MSELPSEGLRQRPNTVLNKARNGVLKGSKGAAADSKTKKQLGTVGFGCPNDTDPHHFVVTIPKERTKPVTIAEHFGLTGEANGLPEKIDRVRLDRVRWRAIADSTKSVLNERLREKGLKTSRWQTGENKMERLLGRELTVLVWAIELADAELVPAAIKNWVGLKPEERWWLFTMTAAATGRVQDADKGWRKALRYALTENPTEALSRDDMWAAHQSDFSALPLFELDE